MIFLIVEDNPRMRESIKRFITENIAGRHTFVDASDGVEAIACVERSSFDWILMDIKMAHMDGIIATRTIKAAHPDAKVIILTSFDEAEYRERAEQAGVYGYVTKDHLSDLLPLLHLPTEHS